MEMFFEEFNFPATYFPSSAMLGSFCYGRSTSLVVDFGASHTTVSPVVDGFVLKKSVVSTARGGNYLDEIIGNFLSTQSIEVKPWYEKKGYCKYDVHSTASFRKLHEIDIIRDLKSWMCFISPQLHDPFSDSISNRIQHMPSYELPDGTQISASESLCLAPEIFLKRSRDRVPIPPNKASSNSSSNTSSKSGSILPPTSVSGMPVYAQPLDINYSLDPIHELIYASVARCDVDCRKELLSNIVLVGGGSLIDGLPVRLGLELGTLLPMSMKVRSYYFNYNNY